MGKGDRKTAKGKRTIGTYGNSRRKKKSVAVIVKPKKKAAKKTVAKADELGIFLVGIDRYEAAFE